MSKFTGLYILAGAALAGCAYVGGKLRVLTKQLDCSISDLAKKSSLEVSEAIVDSAVEKAVSEYTERAVHDISRHIREESDRQIKDSIRTAINSERAKIRDQVAEKVLSAGDFVNTTSFREDVTERAKALVAQKFDMEIDKINEEYREEVRKAAKVYDALRGQQIVPPMFTIKL